MIKFIKILLKLFALISYILSLIILIKNKDYEYIILSIIMIVIGILVLGISESLEKTSYDDRKFEEKDFDLKE